MGRGDAAELDFREDIAVTLDTSQSAQVSGIQVLRTAHDSATSASFELVSASLPLDLYGRYGNMVVFLHLFPDAPLMQIVGTKSNDFCIVGYQTCGSEIPCVHEQLFYNTILPYLDEHPLKESNKETRLEANSEVGYINVYTGTVRTVRIMRLCDDLYTVVHFASFAGRDCLVDRDRCVIPAHQHQNCISGAYPQLPEALRLPSRLDMNRKRFLALQVNGYMRLLPSEDYPKLYRPEGFKATIDIKKEAVMVDRLDLLLSERSAITLARLRPGYACGICADGEVCAHTEMQTTFKQLR